MSPRPVLVGVMRKILRAINARAAEAREPSIPNHDEVSNGSSSPIREFDQEVPRPPTPYGGQRTASASIYSRDVDGRPLDDSDLHFPVPLPEHPRSTLSFSMPAIAGSVESLGTQFIHHRLSRDTTMLNASSMDQVIRHAVEQHPAIADNPPPFARYSAPQPHEQAVSKRATLVHQEQLRLEKRCMSIDEEREHLATQLELVAGELAEANERLEEAQGQITATVETSRELQESDRELQEQCDRLKIGFEHATDCLDRTADQLRQVQKKYNSCMHEGISLKLRVETLQSCKMKSRAHLKRKIDELGLQLQKFPALLQTVDNLQADKRVLSEQNDRIPEYLKQIHNQEQRIAELESLQVDRAVFSEQRERIQSQEQRIADLESQCEEDSAKLRLSRTSLFDVHQKLRQTERELRRRETLLDIVILNVQDLELDIYCLKEQMKGMDRVYPVHGGPWPPLSRVISLPVLV